MWDLHTLHKINNEATTRSLISGNDFLLVTDRDLPLEGRSIPHCGSREVDLDLKYNRIETLFVDSSGWGAEDESALTMPRFLERVGELVSVHGHVMLGTIEIGQFQLYVGVWVER